MRENRFIGDYDLSEERLVVSDSALAGQVSKVLRLKAGDKVTLVNGRGSEATAMITGVKPSEVSFALSDRRACAGEPAVSVTLYCAILKRENFETVVQKAVECGVYRIVPVVSSRTVKLGIRADRLAKIAKEAAEQSGRGIVPEIAEPMSLADALVESDQLDAAVMFEIGRPLFGPATLASQKTRTVGVFVGPEGGWSAEEVEQAADASVQAVGLGKRTLRAETAAIVATFLAATVGE